MEIFFHLRMENLNWYFERQKSKERERKHHRIYEYVSFVLHCAYDLELFFPIFLLFSFTRWALCVYVCLIVIFLFLCISCLRTHSSGNQKRKRENMPNKKITLIWLRSSILRRAQNVSHISLHSIHVHSIFSPSIYIFRVNLELLTHKNDSSVLSHTWMWWFH